MGDKVQQLGYFGLEREGLFAHGVHQNGKSTQSDGLCKACRHRQRAQLWASGLVSRGWIDRAALDQSGYSPAVLAGAGGMR
jgi:hypothetical protein